MVKPERAFYSENIAGVGEHTYPVIYRVGLRPCSVLSDPSHMRAQSSESAEIDLFTETGDLLGER